MTIGLVLGKFAPLHKGHELLIKTAIAENKQVVVLIYDAPDVISVPLPVRSGWIKTLFPEVRVVEAWDGPLEVGSSPEIKKMHEDYILSILEGERITLEGKRITSFYSSEFYGEHVSKALGAIDRRIDPDRSLVPISATAIRENTYNSRRFVDPVVYRDLVTKVVFLGAPSSGKTTLAKELAARFDTVWMPEYGREYWEEHQCDRRLTLEQLVEIAEGHCAKEDDLILEANKTIFVDTDASTTRIFSLYYHDEVHPRLEELAAAAASRYDLVFLCDIDIPYEDTWDRSGEVSRREFQRMIKADLDERKIPYHLVSGKLRERIQQVSGVLSDIDKGA